MASKTSNHNIDNKGKKIYKFKKLRTVENTIEFSAYNQGIRTLTQLQHLILLPTLKTNTLQVRKRFLKHQWNFFLPLRKTDLKRALLNVLNGNTLVSGADPGGGRVLRYDRYLFNVFNYTKLGPKTHSKH